MASLIGKALAVRNSTPVPLGGGGQNLSAYMAMTGPADETLMRSYSENGTVNANVGLLASATAGPEWRLYRKQPRDGRVRYTTSDQGSDQRTEVVQHQALNVLNTPAAITVGKITLPVFTRFQLFEVSGIWLETTGKSHWVVDNAERRSPFPLGLWPVRPDRMEPVPDRKNFLAGWIYTAPDGQEKIPLLPTEVVFNRYPDPLDPYGGCGPIQSVLTDIAAARSAAEWNNNYFANSAEPGGVIQVDHSMEDDEFDELVTRWRESHRGVARAHRIAVLEGGQTWVPNSHSMRDMDFAALRGVSRDIIREALRQHKVMTGVTDDVNRANAQTGEEVFASWSVLPRLNRWKDILNTQFLPLFGSTGEGVEFDFVFPMPLNREQDNAELTAKATAWLALVQGGADPHDALKVVGLPDMDMAAAPAAADAPPGPGPEGEPAPAESDAQNRLLPWAPFELNDRRFVQVNGHSLVEVR